MFFYAFVFILICLKFIMTKKPKMKPDEEDASGWEPSCWTKSSPHLLADVEKKILSSLRTSYHSRYVDIGPVVGEEDRIWTLSLNEESKKTPLVLLHGFASGVALWVLNLDDFAQDRPVYAIDILGFGRSSRPKFSSVGKIVEMQMVAVLEEWRREMKIDKFILLGHSLGAYISTSYTMQYPERVQHLILGDPWGIAERPDNVLDHYKVPFWIRVLVHMFRPLNPLWALRVAGPWGEGLIGKARGKLVAKFCEHLPQAEKVIPQYIHQCNSQTPSGESAFHAMMHMWAFAKNPMIRRIKRLHEATPLTFVFGAKSWVKSDVGEIVQKERSKSPVDIHIIPESGHHVYLDQPELFNKLVMDICLSEDKID